MAEVVHQEVEESKDGPGVKWYRAKVVLSDGRTGTGVSQGWFGGNTAAQALSRAIEDARSKPIPGK